MSFWSLTLCTPRATVSEQSNQYVRYIHSCPELAIWFKMSGKVKCRLFRSGIWIIFLAKTWLLDLQPRFGLAEDSRIIDFWLGLLAPIVISMASSRQLWTYPWTNRVNIPFKHLKWSYVMLLYLDQGRSNMLQSWTSDKLSFYTYIIVSSHPNYPKIGECQILTKRKFHLWQLPCRKRSLVLACAIYHRTILLPSLKWGPSSKPVS